jgi:hypothetical protein
MKMSFYSKILVPFFVLVALSTSAQEEQAKDSAAIYKKIEKFSKRRGFTKFLHGLIFEPVQSQSAVPKARVKTSPKRRRSYQGKVIRNIHIQTLDPFGYSEKDVSRVPKRYWEKTGNRIHVKTREWAIKNLLLFSKNSRYDSLVIQETERLIRSQRYIRSVQITAVQVSKTSDSVDVSIRALDSWSLVPDLQLSASNIRADLTDRNFVGTGHTFQNRYEQDPRNGRNALGTRYTVPNILNTYIRTSASYQETLQGFYARNLDIDRPFFSPLARWAGGIYFDQQFRHDTLPNSQLQYSRQNFKIDTQDYWGAYAIPLFKGDTEQQRTTSLISSLRFYKTHYRESPDQAYDTINYYTHERFVLGGIGISSRQFIEDKFIFNYNVVEDVPVGRAAGLTMGWQEKNGIGRPYIGARASAGNYFKWGYLSGNAEYGTFIYNGQDEQSAITVQTNYFSPLVEVGSWKLRQFFKARAVLGQNRQASEGDQLTLDEPSGIPGFRNTDLWGTKKALLTLQTQAYAPWNFLGFRLNPYLSYSLGFLANSGEGLFQKQPYSKMGLGVIVTNDYLVFSSFQISIAYFPVLPRYGENLFRTNAFSSNDFGYLTFEVDKPRTVDYQ